MTTRVLPNRPHVTSRSPQHHTGVVRSGRCRPRRLLALLGVVVMAALALLAWTPTTARAASADQIEQFVARFEVQRSGVVHVTETFTFRFGSNSGRHGPTLGVVTRERYDKDHDQTYEYRNLTVSSPDAPATLNRSTTYSQGGRTGFQTWRIGDPDHTVKTPTAHYAISYDLVGALRHFSGYDEFYWDVLSDNTAFVSDANLTLTVPGGVQAVTCNVGPAHTQKACEQARVENATGVYTVKGKQSNDILTISGKIRSGMVSNPDPVLVEAGDRAGDRARKYAFLAMPIAVACPYLLAWLMVRRTRDERFAGLPPGILPAPGQEAQVVRSGHVEIPVAFAPPSLTLADASLLTYGVVGRNEMAATIVQLATQGALTMGGANDQKPWVQLVDPSRAANDQQKLVLDALFADGQNRLELGKQVELGTAGQFYDASRNLSESARDHARQGGWFRHLPSFRQLRLLQNLMLGVGILWGFVYYGLNQVHDISGAQSAIVMLLIVFSVSTITAGWWVRRSGSKGSRTATGRALTDQVEGFRTYLATAEAEQLRFEEGEDIYSRYLPWAIIFNLTDRWAKVCARLVELGRLSAQPPAWYSGDPVFWNYHWFNSQVSDVSTAVGPEPSSSSVGWGGGGSSFSDGGSSGGGGGGTSIGSW